MRKDITIERIMLGGENDLNNLNVNWLGGTKKMYNELKSK